MKSHSLSNKTAQEDIVLQWRSVWRAYHENDAEGL